MEGRVGYPARPFNFGGLPMGFCPVKRDPLQCFGTPGVENSGSEPTGEAFNNSLFCLLDLTFLQKNNSRKSRTIKLQFFFTAEYQP